jgi:hypothetical protein
VEFYKNKKGFLLFELSISMIIELIVVVGFVFMFNFVFIDEIKFLSEQYLASELFVSARMSSTHAERYTLPGFRSTKVFAFVDYEFYNPEIYFKIQYDYTNGADQYLFFYDYLNNYVLDHTKIGGRIINSEKDKLLNVIPVTGGLTLP